MFDISQSDMIGLIGIAISLLGFAVSIYQLWKTKSAAEKAQDAAFAASLGVRRLDSLIGFSSVSKSIDEIKEAYRKDEYEKLSTLFDSARKALITARENHPKLDATHRESIQKHLIFLKSMEIEILTSDQEALKRQKSRFMKTLIDMSDGMTVILSETKSMELPR